MRFNTATIMAKGQIFLPTNIALYAMEMLQKEMIGEAEKAGLTTEEDIIALCREVRAEVEGL